jgi:hypothetical protein
LKSAEGTLTENGSKWSKKKKRRSEVRESYPLKEKIKEDRSTKNMDRGQLNKQKKPPTDALEHLAEKKEEQAGEALKIQVVWDLGFWYLGF